MDFQGDVAGKPTQIDGKKPWFPIDVPIKKTINEAIISGWYDQISDVG